MRWSTRRRPPACCCWKRGRDETGLTYRRTITRGGAQERNPRVRDARAFGEGVDEVQARRHRVEREREAARRSEGGWEQVQQGADIDARNLADLIVAGDLHGDHLHGGRRVPASRPDRASLAQMSTSSAQVREHLVDVLSCDLVGAQPDEVLSVAPSR